MQKIFILSNALMIAIGLTACGQEPVVEQTEEAVVEEVAAPDPAGTDRVPHIVPAHRERGVQRWIISKVGDALLDKSDGDTRSVGKQEHDDVDRVPFCGLHR